MLRFLKALFGKATQAAATPARATVPVGELAAWLQNTCAPASARLAEHAIAARTSIGQLATAAREKLQALQSAQLMNQDIPERAKDYMRGNREEYCRRVQQYIDGLALPETEGALPSFFNQHAQDAAEFTKGILRPFQILQEFFAHESKEITALLAQMEQELITLSAAHEQAKLAKHETARDAIDALITRQQQRRGLEHEHAELDQQRAEAERSLAALNAEEERLLKDADRQRALQQLAEAQRRIKAHEQKIRDTFAQFEPALRKFHRMATRNVALVERYLRDPVATLIEDLHLELLDIIADIQRLLTFDRIPLGDKKEHVLDAIAQLSKDALGTWLREYGQLAKAEKGAQRAVEECEASKTLARIQRLREDTRRSQQLSEQRLALLQKDLGKINLDQMKTALEEQLTQLTGTAVTITP